MSPYNGLLMAHFCAPRHVGALVNAQFLRLQAVAADEELALYWRLQSGQLCLSWLAHGGPALIAAASLFADVTQGMSRAALRTLDVAALLEPLQLPPTKRYVLLLVEDALQQLKEKLDD